MMPTRNKDKLFESQQAAEHVAEFLAKGGKIQQIANGESAQGIESKSAFVITPGKARKGKEDE